MKLTVLGCSTPVPKRDQPCSGYLLSDTDTTVLLDCGSGVFPVLADVVDPRTLSAVWISHMHPDHCADLVTLANWALNLGDDAPRIRVIGPPEWDTRLNAFMSEDNSRNLVRSVFDVEYLGDGLSSTVGEFRLSSRLVHHSVTTYGVRISNRDGLTFAYSGDTGPCPILEQLAHQADVFLCEAGSETPVEYHMTMRQAQEVARSAAVGKLLLTHIPYDISSSGSHVEGTPPAEIVRALHEWPITPREG